MFCTSCGVALDDTARYCSQCGKPTWRAASASTGATGTQPKLARLMYERNIAGVCAGFARYLQLDVTLIRVLWIAATIFSGGIGLLLYIGCWVVMPKEYEPPAVVAREAPVTPA